MKDVYQLYLALLILILSTLIEPLLLGNHPDSGGIGLAGIFICCYLIMKDRDEEKRSKQQKSENEKETDE